MCPSSKVDLRADFLNLLQYVAGTKNQENEWMRWWANSCKIYDNHPSENQIPSIILFEITQQIYAVI
jgi:hypothetical protein